MLNQLFRIVSLSLLEVFGPQHVLRWLDGQMVLGSTAFCRDMIKEDLSAFKTGVDRSGTKQHKNNNYNPGSLVACRIQQSTILSSCLTSISKLLVPYLIYFIHYNLSRINIISIKTSLIYFDPRVLTQLQGYLERLVSTFCHRITEEHTHQLDNHQKTPAT